MSKIIGLITAWSSEKWIEPAIEQALKYCDEVLVTVTCYHSDLKKFEDGTYNICKKYKNDIKLIDIPVGKMRRTPILNTLLKESNLFVTGNWIWLLDVDEFYTDGSYKEIILVIDAGKYNSIRIEERFFYINMKYYLEASHGRLMRIDSSSDKFKPTNKWTYTVPEKVYIIKRGNGMFHYSMLTNTNIHKYRWGRQEKQMYKVRWLDKIYANYDLNNEGYWLEKNLKLSGIRSPWLNKGFTPDKNGKLFKYKGKHPELIEKAGLPGIEDFRIYYK